MKKKSQVINTVCYPHPFADDKQNVVIYCRVSSDEQGEFGASLAVQKENLTNFCNRNGYNIVMEVQESHTAKHYYMKRPLLKEVYNFCKKNKRRSPMLLFLKWDRYSRNLEFAMQHIRIMREEYKLELNSVENYVDFKSPDWPTLIGVYCGNAQSENTKISQRTRDGIHGTLESGRISGRAPRGYINKQETDCNGKTIAKYIAIDWNVARGIQKAFNAIAEGGISANYARKKYCPNIASSTFLDLLRNPNYMGKIRVPAYNGTPEHLVESQHEPLITEEVFYRVQDNLDGKKKNKPKLGKASNPDLFLRRFITCPVCGHALTGSASRGNGGYYTYYNCCEDPKHIRVRADKAIDLFARYLSCLRPNEAIMKLYEAVLNDVQGDSKREINAEIKEIERSIATKQEQITNTEDLMCSNPSLASRCEKMLLRYESEVAELEEKVEILKTANRGNIEPKLDYAMSLINNMDKYIRDAPVEVKIKLIGSMFDEKIEFDGESYRTNSFNKVLELIYEQTNELRGGEKKSREEDCSSPRLGTRTRARTEMGCPTGV